MKKTVKIKGLVFALLFACFFSSSYSRAEGPTADITGTDGSSVLREKPEDFSLEEIAKINLIVKKEFDRLYEEKSKEEISEEITNLNRKLESLRKKCARYKHKLRAKKDYVSPETLKSEVDKVKVNLVLEFNRYLSDYINNSENKGKKLKQLDLGKIFSNFININFTFNNPNDVNVSPTLIKGEARGTIAGAALGI